MTLDTVGILAPPASSVTSWVLLSLLLVDCLFFGFRFFFGSSGVQRVNATLHLFNGDPNSSVQATQRERKYRSEKCSNRIRLERMMELKVGGGFLWYPASASLMQGDGVQTSLAMNNACSLYPSMDLERLTG